MNITNASTNNIVFNNIFYSDHAFRGSITIEPGSMTGFHSDFNVLTDRMSTDDGNTAISLAQWQLSMHCDSNSFIALPDQLFVNEGGDDYHLLFTSPAMDQGTGSYFSTPAPTNDLEDSPRPWFNGFDIGCYETFPEGIHEISNQQVSEEIASGDYVLLFDLSGRLVFDGNNEQSETSTQVIPGLYCYIAYSPLSKNIKRGKILFAR
jgi:hypothetical protein